MYATGFAFNGGWVTYAIKSTACLLARHVPFALYWEREEEEKEEDKKKGKRKGRGKKEK
jgi:hypothetical protein